LIVLYIQTFQTFDLKLKKKNILLALLCNKKEEEEEEGDSQQSAGRRIMITSSANYLCGEIDDQAIIYHGFGEIQSKKPWWCWWCCCCSTLSPHYFVLTNTELLYFQECDSRNRGIIPNDFMSGRRRNNDNLVVNSNKVTRCKLNLERCGLIWQHKNKIRLHVLGGEEEDNVTTIHIVLSDIESARIWKKFLYMTCVNLSSCRHDIFSEDVVGGGGGCDTRCSGALSSKTFKEPLSLSSSKASCCSDSQKLLLPLIPIIPSDRDRNIS
jgi:hypothetical protein